MYMYDCINLHICLPQVSTCNTKVPAYVTVSLKFHCCTRVPLVAEGSPNLPVKGIVHVKSSILVNVYTSTCS